MPDRYYSETTISGPTVTLAGSEAHHLLHVMRAKTGLQLVVFDGKGGEYDATVARCDRREVELEVGSRRDVERELPWELTLAVALPKGDRQRWLVEKAVELGVTQLVPLKTARTVTSAEQSAKLARYVISASKQCGRNRLMPIGPLTTWPELVRQQTSARRLLAHPGGSSELNFNPALTRGLRSARKVVLRRRKPSQPLRRAGKTSPWGAEFCELKLPHWHWCRPLGWGRRIIETRRVGIAHH